MPKVVMAVFMLLLSACTQKTPATLELKNHFIPNLMPFNNKLYLVYELEAKNSGNTAVQINKLEVCDADSQTIIKAYETSQLQIRYLDPKNATVKDTNLTQDVTGLIYVWLELPRDKPLPKSIKSTMIASDAKDKSFTIASPVFKMPPVTTIAIGTPFKDGTWLVAGGPAPASLHRTTVPPVAGPIYLAQRFAIDWISVDSNGRAFKGNGLANSDYDCYNKDLIAVADGTVVATKGDLPENIPGKSLAVKITKETVGGNYVVLQMTNGLYVFYAHIIPGTIKVKVGDKVKKGDVLGSLGNSGNSGAPHLHLHVSNKADPVLSEGVAYVFESFKTLGTNPTSEALLSGGDIFNYNVFEKSESSRTKELPLQGWIVTF